jgi:hypothetical protein
MSRVALERLAPPAGRTARFGDFDGATGIADLEREMDALTDDPIACGRQPLEGIEGGQQIGARTLELGSGAVVDPAGEAERRRALRVPCEALGQR